MNVDEYMKKHGLTDEQLDAMTQPYESGDYGSEDGRVHAGSHFDSVGKRRNAHSHKHLSPVSITFPDPSMSPPSNP